MKLFETYYKYDELSGYSITCCSNCNTELPLNFIENKEILSEFEIHKYTGENIKKIIIKCPKCKCNLIYFVENLPPG
jgi:hypothetical protein